MNQPRAPRTSTSRPLADEITSTERAVRCEDDVRGPIKARRRSGETGAIIVRLSGRVAATVTTMVALTVGTVMLVVSAVGLVGDKSDAHRARARSADPQPVASTRPQSLGPTRLPGGRYDARSAKPSGAVTPSRSPTQPHSAPRQTARRSLANDPELRLRAARLTSTFENATTRLQYGCVENIGDGRGITAGRAGFTSATSDLLLVVRRYTALKPRNVLATYIPALEEVDGSDSVDGLDGFAAAWVEAAKDPVQRAVQDTVVNDLYLTPALRLARAAGVRTPLGEAIVWDTMIQHGEGGEDGTQTIIDETLDERGSAARDEPGWLDAFLDIRLRHLDHMYGDDDSSRSRIEALRSLVADRRMTLALPLTWAVYGQRFNLDRTSTRPD